MARGFVMEISGVGKLRGLVKPHPSAELRRDWVVTSTCSGPSLVSSRASLDWEVYAGDGDRSRAASKTWVSAVNLGRDH